MELVKLSVNGADASSFLQGQLTADMNQLDYLYGHEEDSGLAGLCNIKGRLEAVFWIQKKSAEAFDLYLPKEIAESIATLLKRFVFRSKVTIEVNDADAEELSLIPNDCVIPWIIESTQGKYVPQMVSLDVLKGVHPRKGCYIGQEIVTRLRDLGKNKKRLGQLSIVNQASISVGDSLNLKEKDVAEVIQVKNDEALAVVVLAEVAQGSKLSDNIEVLQIWKNTDE